MDGIMPRDSLFQLRDMFVPPDQGDDSDSDIDDSVRMQNKIEITFTRLSASRQFL